MKINTTHLRLEYYELTKSRVFSEKLDDLLEDDYVNNSSWYTDDIFDLIEAMRLIEEDEIKIYETLQTIRNQNSSR